MATKKMHATPTYILTIRLALQQLPHRLVATGLDAELAKLEIDPAQPARPGKPRHKRKRLPR